MGILPTIHGQDARATFHFVRGSKFHITAKKITVTLGNGTEESHTYKITERPDANTIVVKSKEPGTFIKSGKYLCIPTTGDVQFKMYFKPVD